MAPPLCTLPPGPGPPRFVCFCDGEQDGLAGGARVCVTDGVQLWSTCSAPHSPAALVGARGPGAAQDVVARFRAACQQQAVTLTLQEDTAALTLSGVPPALALDLRKVPAAEAAPRLQALTLGLAERVCSLERRLAAVEAAATAPSPRKSPRPAGPGPFFPEAEPQRGGPGQRVRRRCPGESLINPGFKSKKPAGGVDFEDN